MKSLILIATLLAAASARGHLVSQDQMDDLAFVDATFYNMYNGFIRGLYREHTQHIIDEQCFGTWIQTNLTHLNDVMERLFLSFETITYEESVQAATEFVNLFYLNWDFCAVGKVYDDLKAFCGYPEYSCMTDTNVVENAKKSMIPLGTKVYELFSLLLTSDMLTDEEILSTVDKIGEMYGAIISYLLGFETKFNDHKQLSAAKAKVSNLLKLPKLFH